MMKAFSLKNIFASTAILLATATTSHAQLSHSITAVVNDDIVTTHDLRQRVLFIMATTGAERTEENLARIQQQALRNLVDEKIQIQESEKYDQVIGEAEIDRSCLLYTSPSPRDLSTSRMPSSA